MRHALTLAALAFGIATAAADDSITHRIEVEELPGTILHTNRFLRGDNPETRTMNHANMVRVKYAFMLPDTFTCARIYNDAYQGAGVGMHGFNPLLGNPLSAFIFQGAPIAQLSPRVSFNYEWNLGLTMGWNSYDAETNPYNHVIGSHVTAYLDLDLYCRWQLSPRIDVQAGASFSHYSNGNTAMPNMGLNTLALKAGVAYYMGNTGRRRTGTHADAPAATHPTDGLHRWQTDVLLYGAWKCKGIETSEGAYAVPGRFGVAGINVTPMYRASQLLRLGASLDGVYDHSANLLIGDADKMLLYWTTADDYVRQPRWYKQLALGVSARAEFVMPFFAIHFGIGHHVLYADSPAPTYIVEDAGRAHYVTEELEAHFAGLYEVLALKVNLGRRLFLNIGYSLYDFRYPNNLMLGIGYSLGR